MYTPTEDRLMDRIGPPPTTPVVTSPDQLLPGQIALLDNGTDPIRVGA